MGGRHDPIENRGFLHFGSFARRSTRVLEAEEGIVGATESTCCFNTWRGAKRHDVYAAECGNRDSRLANLAKLANWAPRSGTGSDGNSQALISPMRCYSRNGMRGDNKKGSLS